MCLYHIFIIHSSIVRRLKTGFSDEGSEQSRPVPISWGIHLRFFYKFHGIRFYLEATDPFGIEFCVRWQKWSPFIFSMLKSSSPNTICWRCLFFPVRVFCISIKSQAAVVLWICIWVPYSISVPGPCCIYYYGSVVKCEYNNVV